MTDGYILKIIGGVVATVGFGVLFKLKPKLLPFAAIVSLAASISYFTAMHYLENEFVSNMLGTFLAAAISEYFAKKCKAPSTVFLLPGCVVLVPGGSLYYTMYNIVLADYNGALEKLLVTVEVGIGIGSGIIIVSFIKYLFEAVIRYINEHKKMSD